MIFIFTILLFFAVLTKFFPPKKPNFLYGYQLGSAKKGIEHWKTANKYASNYLIILYSFLILLSLTFDYTKYDGRIVCLIITILGLISIYFLIESKLKSIIV
jgi:uncharacterized membrane protein